MHVTSLLHLLSLSLLSNPAHAACTTFKRTAFLPLTDPASTFHHHVSHSETAPVSPGIVCGNITATRQIYNPTGIAVDNCKPDACLIVSHGRAYAWAQTNITHNTHFPSPANAAGRIAALAAASPGWTLGRGLSSALAVGGTAAGVTVCLPHATAGWLQMTPYFRCAEGTLHGCGKGGGVAPEREGAAVAVCVPEMVDTTTTELNGVVKLHTAPASAAEKLKTNPAASGDVPGGGVGRGASGAMGWAAAAAAALVALLAV